MLAAVPVHHSCGSCSDQSGFGVWSVSGVVAEAATAPFSSISSALAPVVETSMPRKRACLRLQERLSKREDGRRVASLFWGSPQAPLCLTNPSSSSIVSWSSFS